jgi:hypothetical protein
VELVLILVAVIGGLAGLAGALLGAKVAAGATLAAAKTVQEESRADRLEARRTRFADQVNGLTVEVLEAVQVDLAALDELWARMERDPGKALRAPVPTVTRLGLRLRLLLVESDARTALARIEGVLDEMGHDLEMVSDPEIDEPHDDEAWARWNGYHNEIAAEVGKFEEAIRGELSGRD